MPNQNQAHTKLISETITLINMFEGQYTVRAYSTPQGGTYTPASEYGPGHYNKQAWHKLVGHADILVMAKNNKQIWLECKTGEGVQSPAQKEFEAWCAKCSIPYCVFHDKGEALAFLKFQGVLGGKVGGV